MWLVFMGIVGLVVICLSFFRLVGKWLLIYGFVVFFGWLGAYMV